MHKLSGGNHFSYTKKCFQFIKDLFHSADFHLESESAESTNIMSYPDNIEWLKRTQDQWKKIKGGWNYSCFPLDSICRKEDNKF